MEPSRSLIIKHSYNLLLCMIKKKKMAIKISPERDGVVWNVSSFKNETPSCFQWKIFVTIYMNIQGSYKFLLFHVSFAPTFYHFLHPCLTVKYHLQVISQVIYIKGYGENSRCSWINFLWIFFVSVEGRHIPKKGAE